VLELSVTSIFNEQTLRDSGDTRPHSIWFKINSGPQRFRSE
jgi:hypothetical protein